VVYAEMVMTVIKITCRTTWHEQCQWIRKHCKNYTDYTNWQMWNLGMADIYFGLRDEDAIWFKLRWS
jgi:hypothetical protein